MLRAAFNAMTLIHSRPSILRRPGVVDTFTPCRITPSNYFRNLRGPEATNIHGREFIIPVDTILGQPTQVLGFVTVPDSGDYNLNYNGTDTALFLFSATAADIQTELRLIPGLQNIEVTGDNNIGFTFLFAGFQAAPLGITIVNSTLVDVLLDPVVTSFVEGFSGWSGIKRSDRILDSIYGNLTIDEIVEMVDLGGSIMGYRVRTE